MLKKKLVYGLVFGLMAIVAIPSVRAEDKPEKAATEKAAAVEGVNDPLDAFSEDISIVVRLQKPSEVTGNLVKYITNVKEQYGQIAQGMSGLVGLLISNPAQQGVDKSKDWWVAVLPEGQEPPKVIFAIPTTDASELKSAIPESYTSTVFKNWVIYSDNGDAISAIEEGIKAKSIKSIRSKIDAEATKLISGSSIGAFVNVKSLTDIYKNEIEMGIQQAEGALKQFQSMSPAVQGIDMNAMLGLYADLFHAIVQGIKDTNAITVGVTVTENDLIVERLTQVEKDSKTDNFIKVHKTSKMEVLGKLAPNQLGYFGFQCDTKSLIDFSLDMMAKVIPDGNIDENAVKSIKEKISNLSIGSSVGSFSLGSLEEGALRFVTVYEASPVDKVKELTEAYIELSKQFQTPMVKQEISFEKAAETISGQKIDVMTIIQEFSEEADPLGMSKQVYAAMYGPEGMQARIAYLDKVVIQTVGGGKKAMETSLAAAKGNASESVNSSVRSKLTENANLIGLIDIPSLAIKAVTLVVDSGTVPLPIDTDALSELGIRPSYLGVSLAVEPQSVRGRLVVPAQQVQGILKLVEYFQKMRQEAQF